MVRCGQALVTILAASLLACGSTGSNPNTYGAGGIAGAATAGVAGAATAGVGGTAAGDTASLSEEPVPPVDGRWAMFAFEDPVGIELTQSGGVLSGIGCYGGLPATGFPELERYCRPLSGGAEGRHVRFAFAAEQYTYAANVYVSRDGQRMAGDFHDTGSWHSSFTWLRIGTDYPWLRESKEPSAVGLALEARAARYELEGLVDHFDRPGSLAVIGYLRTVVGTLGSFWESEMTWNDAEQTLVAGPVPETAPHLATQLTLHYSGLVLVSVDAVFPSGEARSFAARNPASR